MIVINGRFLSQRLTGIQRFAYENCCALQQIGMELVILAPENIEPAYDLSALPVEIIGGKGWMSAAQSERIESAVLCQQHPYRA